MCRVKCCSHCLLCCEVACPPFPSRLHARSNDVTYAHVDSIVLWAVVLPGGPCDSSRNTIIVYVYNGMVERFRWRLTSRERYSLGGLLRRSVEFIAPASILCPSVSESLAEYGEEVVRLPLGLRSLTLLLCFPGSSLVLCSYLTLQAMAPKAYLTGKQETLRQVAAKQTRKKFGGPWPPSGPILVTAQSKT